MINNDGYSVLTDNSPDDHYPKTFRHAHNTGIDSESDYQRQRMSGKTIRYSQVAPVATHEIRKVEPATLESDTRMSRRNGPGTEHQTATMIGRKKTASIIQVTREIPIFPLEPHAPKVAIVDPSGGNRRKHQHFIP